MRGIFGIDPGWGVTAVRVVLAVILLAAGLGKLSSGVESVTESFVRMGIPAAAVMAPLVIVLEVVGGSALLLGLLTRWVAALVTIQFAVITFGLKLFEGFGAARLDLLMLAGAVLLALAGPGRAALDALWLERPPGGPGEQDVLVDDYARPQRRIATGS
jgi:putative oxidoreductase